VESPEGCRRSQIDTPNRPTTTRNTAMASHVMIVRRGGLKSKTASPKSIETCSAPSWLCMAKIIAKQKVAGAKAALFGTVRRRDQGTSPITPSFDQNRPLLSNGDYAAKRIT
jgi:hypothetical protein